MGLSAKFGSAPCLLFTHRGNGRLLFLRLLMKKQTEVHRLLTNLTDLPIYGLLYKGNFQSTSIVLISEMRYCEISKEMSSFYFGVSVFCLFEARVPEFDTQPLLPNSCGLYIVHCVKFWGSIHRHKVQDHQSQTLSKMTVLSWFPVNLDLII